MSIEREIGKGLSFIDNIVSDITRRSMSQGSVKNFEIFLTTPIDDYCLIDMADFLSALYVKRFLPCDKP